MYERENRVASAEWIPVLLQGLEKGKKIEIIPDGYSMYPFLVSKRDKVILTKLPDKVRRGDICLFRRPDGIHVVHTVHHLDESGYYFVGDSQREIEGPVPAESVLARADAIVRREKTISCDCWSYRCIHGIWLNIRPMRYTIIMCWMKIRHLIGKDKRDEALKLELKSQRGINGENK